MSFETGPFSLETRRIAATVNWADRISATKSETAAFRAGWFAGIRAVYEIVALLGVEISKPLDRHEP